jgi:hypothetical protein
MKKQATDHTDPSAASSGESRRIGERTMRPNSGRGPTLTQPTALPSR